MDLEQPLAALGGRIPPANWGRQSPKATYGEIRGEDARLGAWARRTGCFLNDTAIAELADSADRRDGGEEHEVFLYSEREAAFVLRLTHGNMFGHPDRTPREYLSRWRTFNQLFPAAAVEFEGYAQNAWGNGIIVTRQPLINGEKRSLEAIAEALLPLGFEASPDRDFCFIHPASAIEIHDAHEDNVLFDGDGNMIPIDVWIYDPNDLLG
ncbi:hypothetical protein [Luteolibacter sp. Populi]|uniref:putative polyvalent protein kinase domain-containing protein n=1 Tax=Luteolibacter sp. Populi TaxID=3230487 RepID=UPI003467AFAE